jgi:type IV secretory pathway TrbD component
MTNILVIVIILHLIAGFGFVLWKVAGPVKKDDEKKEKE